MKGGGIETMKKRKLQNTFIHNLKNGIKIIIYKGKKINYSVELDMK